MTRFADLIGQELASKMLKKAVRDDRVTHSYLFAGPEGVGKLTAALAFAAALNCDSPTSDSDACGACASCKAMASGNHRDIDVISPKTAQTKIEQTQEMRRTAYFAPIKGRWKVMIVEQADTLNDDSSSAILKTLEEPPPYLVIILIARNPALLLPTIRSRCMLVRFSSVDVETLARALVDRFGVEEEQARFLATYSEGRPGIAISLVDNTEFLAWRERMADLAEDIFSSKLGHALRLSEKLQKLASGAKDEDDEEEDSSEENPKPAAGGKRVAMRTAIDTLILWYRDLLSISARGKSAEIINSDLRDRLAPLAGNPRRMSSAIETLLWARRAIERNANAQLISDVTMMRLVNRR